MIEGTHFNWFIKINSINKIKNISQKTRSNTTIAATIINIYMNVSTKIALCDKKSKRAYDNDMIVPICWWEMYWLRFLDLIVLELFLL